MDSPSSVPPGPAAPPGPIAPAGPTGSATPPGPGFGAPAVDWQPQTRDPGRASVSALARIAAMVLAVLGALLALLGVGFLLLGQVTGSLSDFSGLPGAGPGFANAVGSLVVAVGGFFIVVGLIEIVSGIGAWMGREWGRFIGIVYGILGTLFLIAALGNPQADRSGVAITVILLICYLYVTIVLAVRWKVRRPA